MLGQRLVHVDGEQRLSGLIVETEAYVGQDDLACHARAGRTARTAVMFGPAGHAYVYFTYGIHWLLNCVTEREGFPAAVLLRAIVPQAGVAVMRRRRKRRDSELTNGPAKLTQALNIDKRHYGYDMCAPGATLFIEHAMPPPATHVISGPRVGIDSVPEPWRGKAWNFRLAAIDV